MEERSERRDLKPTSGKYVSWRNDKLKSTQDDLQWWKKRDIDKAKVIDTLEAEIKALQKQLEDGSRREEDLKKSLADSLSEIQKQRQDNADLRQMLYFKNSTYAENQQMLADTHAQYTKALARIGQERDYVVIHMQRKMDTCRTMAIQTHNAFMEMKKQKKVLEHEVATLKQELCQLEEEKKNVVENLTEQLTQKDHVIENEKLGRKADNTNAVFKKMEQQKIITKQTESIMDLEKEKQSLNHLLTSTAKKCAVLSNKVEEIDVVKEGMRAVGFEMAAEKETNFVLKTGVNALRREIKLMEKDRMTEKETYKEMQERLGETVQLNNKLVETNKLLTSKLKMSEKELSKKQEEARVMGTRLLRVHTDIETCARNIDCPKKLKMEVQRIKESYPYSYENVRVGDETKEDYQLRIFCLNQKLHLTETCNHNHNMEVKRLQRQMNKDQEQLYMSRADLIKLLKEKTVEAEHLRKELSKVSAMVKRPTAPRRPEEASARPARLPRTCVSDPAMGTPSLMQSHLEVC